MHLTRALISSGEKVLALDRRLPGEVVAATLEEIDLLEENALAGVFDRHPPSAIYHLAARSSAALSFKDPKATFQVNFGGTLNILQLCLDRDPNVRILFAGTSEEYGPHPETAMPLGEEAGLNPVSPYAVSKASATLLCRQYGKAHGLPIVIARSFSHTGPGQVPVFAFPSWAHQIAMIEADESDPVIEVGNLEPLRDYTSVHDVVRAYQMLMAGGRPGEIYNVCSGEGRRMRDYLEDLLGAAKSKIRVEVDPNRLRPADVPFMVGDRGKIERDIGWKPEVPREDWISELLDYWRATVLKQKEEE